jgi:hypothetical protein
MFSLVAFALLAQVPPQCTIDSSRVWVITESAVVAKKATTQTIFTTRVPQGHTHTCVNGHTWDHAANPTHVCKFCGASQFVVDSPSRPVTVVRTFQVQAEATAPQTRAPAAPLFSVFRSVQAGGCANGQCSTIQRR